MKLQLDNPSVHSGLDVDKKLYFRLVLVGLCFLASYIFKTTALAETLGIASFTELPNILAFIAKLLLLTTLVLYIISAITAEEP